MFGSIGLQEILIVGLVFGLLMGVNRVPALLKGLGEGIAEFKKGIRGEEKEEK